MNRIKICVKSLLLISVFLLICSFPASADDKITLIRPIPDEFSQNGTLDIFFKTTYSEGSYIRYNLNLEAVYPSQGKFIKRELNGFRGRISGNRTFIIHDKKSLDHFSPGDWNLTIWEESNPDKAYSKIIHIYPAGMEPEDEPVLPDFCNPEYENPRQNFKLSPEPDATAGIFAKGQPLHLTGKGLSGTKTGVWTYQATEDSKDGYSHFEVISTDCNGDILGKGEILPVFNSYNMPQGRYYVYAVSGDFEYIEKEIIPPVYTELENLILENKNLQYQKFTFLAEEPEISIIKNIPKYIEIGTQLEIEGTTNLKSGTILEIVVSSSVVDYDSYQGIIVQETEVFPFNSKNRWESVIDTSVLGPGEYTISVESPKGLGKDSTTLNTYYEVYSVSESSEDVLSKITYDVDRNTKSITDKTEIQNFRDYSAGYPDDFTQDCIFAVTGSEMPKTTISKAGESFFTGISLLLRGGF